MVTRIDGMPEGTIGLQSVGKLTRQDYREVPEPVLAEAFKSGELRLLFLVSDYGGLEPGAWIEDLKTGLNAWVGHHSAWRRLALVTDVDWMVKAMRMFSWLAPGEVSAWPCNELEEAKAWVAG